jgi:hypothetical protein
MSGAGPPSLYAAREPVFPPRVKGSFRTLKWWIMGVILGISSITPWLRWDWGPSLPDQAVLVDLANRRFFFFMIEIWPHEVYFVAGLLIMAGPGLFLLTNAFAVIIGVNVLLAYKAISTFPGLEVQTPTSSVRASTPARPPRKRWAGRCSRGAIRVA